VSAAVSNLAQYWWSGPTFGGLSGVGHAMFGYVWMKYRFQPELRFVIPNQLMWMFWIWFVLCFTGLVGPIANGAHAVGLAVGILYGMVPFL
jgi:GlpG protein